MTIFHQERRIEELEAALAQRGTIAQLQERAAELQQLTQDARGRLGDVVVAWRQAEAKAKGLEALLREWMAIYGRQSKDLDRRCVALLSGKPDAKA